MSIDPSVAQRLAADGAASVWVAASAGTGKTKVLTDRVLNLLLRGTPPARILCLTFTKAAAAEMAIRLNKRLSEWAIIGDVKLSADIADISGALPEPGLMARARQLFARVLDTPGGMRILTLHAFCQSILRRFPLEAGIAPQFEVMDERSAAELLQSAQTQMLLQARAEPDSALAEALSQTIAHSGEQGFTELMDELTKERGRLARLLSAAGGLEPYLARLYQRLGVRPGEDEAGYVTSLADETGFDAKGLRRAAAALAQSKLVSDKKLADGLAAWLAADLAGRIASYAHYQSLFLTQALTPTMRLGTKGVLQANPWLEDVLRLEQARIGTAQQELAAITVARASGALIRLADAFLGAYAIQKRLHALLDYDDLILTTRDLLARPGVAPWVLFKLDGGIDHILIDEAQDTNPDQWQVVAALAEEFFTGQGGRDIARTIFAVGDAKQSIFSFQRADPREFLRMRDHFATRVTEAKQIWRTVPLDISFRSTSAVLALVDAVFAQDDARDGVALDGAPIHHAVSAKRAGQAGRIELWPPLAPEEAPEPEAWAPPVEQVSAEAPRARLAQLIARTIKHWLESGHRLDSKDRPVKAGDIMVLVRRRGGFVAELLRELKRLDVPVGGADRMVLSRQIAVMDLIALGSFLLLPEDDLTLATVLKGPLIGLDDDHLFTLAHQRKASLWQALKGAAQPWAVAAREYLGSLLGRADYVPPHELYAEILSARQGRVRLIARLGHEAADAIEEFLSQSLAYERTHIPSLQGFLHWLSSGAVEVKRDLDQAGRDEVRIMTVHGAKGLQAPIVFLPDTLSTPSQIPPLLWDRAGDLMLWCPKRGAGEPLAMAARADAVTRRDQEYRRLLYVALTRAEDRLYVCGWQTGRQSAALSWYHLVQNGLQGFRDGFQTIPVPPGWPAFDGQGLILTAPQTAPPEGDKPADAPPPAPVETLPRFATTLPEPEPRPASPLIPAQPLESEPPSRSPLGESGDLKRFQRGLLIHRLMQTLPDLAPDERESAARRYLARQTHGLPPEEQAQIRIETLAVLDHPEFAPLFGPGSRAEVPVVGLIQGRALSGRLDRLVVTDDAVLIVDYKTNRPPPRDVGGVAAAYLDQLAAYRAALEQIYPGKPVRTLLLWTDGPRLMEISPALPQAALRLGSAP